jgi:hypothetical protein
VTGRLAYLAGFLARFFFADGDFLCGSGGVASIRRSTASIAEGSRFGFSSFIAAASHEKSNVSPFDHRNRIAGELRQLMERWNNRLTPKGLAVLKEYIEGRLKIALELEISGQVVGYTYLSVAINQDRTLLHDEGAVGSVEAQVNESASGAVDRRDEHVLVNNVGIVQCAQGLIPSIAEGPYFINQHKGHPTPDSLFKSTMNGVYKFLPIVSKRQTIPSGGHMSSLSDHVTHQNVQGCSEIVNSVPNDQGNLPRWRLSDLDYKLILSGISIFLDRESAKVSLEVIHDQRVKVADVLLGPFDL